MRVLHILEAFSGGTRRHVLDLLPALVQRGVPCTLVASPNRNPSFREDVALLESKRVKVIELPMSRGLDPAGDTRAAAALTSILRNQWPDIVHCHSTKAGLLGRLTRVAIANRPLVYTPHCLAFDTKLPAGQRRAARVAESLLASLTSRYIAVSVREARLIGSSLGRGSRVSLISNGIALDEFDALPPASRQDYGLREDDFVIGCFGRLSAQKNQAALIRALPDLARAIPRVVLFFVGDGEDHATLEELGNQAQALSGARIVWAGEQQEARTLYALCDIVAQPSRWEGCPYSVLEAMSAARPVVARAVGGVSEILDGLYGVTYRASEGRELSEILIDLAHHKDARDQLGKAARRRIEEHFTRDAMVERTIAAYEGVVVPAGNSPIRIPK